MFLFNLFFTHFGFWLIKPVKLRYVLLKCLYQGSTMSGHMFVLGVSILPLWAIFILHFGNVQTVWYFFYHFIAFTNKE